MPVLVAIELLCTVHSTVECGWYEYIDHQNCDLGSLPGRTPIKSLTTDASFPAPGEILASEWMDGDPGRDWLTRTTCCDHFISKRKCWVSGHVKKLAWVSSRTSVLLTRIEMLNGRGYPCPFLCYDQGQWIRKSFDSWRRTEKGHSTLIARIIWGHTTGGQEYLAYFCAHLR
jgi:hypothetical protein